MGKEIFWDQNLVPFRFFARRIWAPIRLKSGGNQGFPALVLSRVLRELSVLWIHTFSDETTAIDAWTDEKDINCSSLRKQPFLLALRRWGRFASRNVKLNKFLFGTPWAADHYVNIDLRSQNIAPCKEIHETLGFWIPRHGFRILIVAEFWIT